MWIITFLTSGHDKSMGGLSPFNIIENSYTHFFLPAHDKRYSPGEVLSALGSIFDKNLSHVFLLVPCNLFYESLVPLEVEIGDIFEWLSP